MGWRMSTSFIAVIAWFALLAGIAALKRQHMENVLTLVWLTMIVLGVVQVIYYAAR